jgi:hypothetical protein
MKRSIIRYSFLFLLAGTLGSCSKYLDKQPDDMLTLDQVFEQQAETEKYLANVYSYLPPSEGDGNVGFGASFTPVGDEADFGCSCAWANYEQNIGNWGPATDGFNNWRPMYKGIRAASVFINRVGENKQMSPELISRRRAEARFLRAYFYTLLLRQYGPVVLITDATPIDVDPAELQVSQTPYDEVVDYVVSELDMAKADLPATITDAGEKGRIDQLVVQATKARLLLYAASPLFNGNQDYAGFTNKDGKPLFSATVDNEKWKKAADASKALIDMMPAGLYDPVPSNPRESYRRVFLDRWNQEIIWGRKPKNDLLNWHWLSGVAPTATGGTAEYGATQQMVDAYFMANGQQPITGYSGNGSPIINPASGYTETGFTATATENYKAGVSNMYVGREPRFYANISFNGSEWINHGTSGTAKYYFEFWNGGRDVVNSPDNYAKPGYVIRKFAHPNSIWSGNSGERRFESLVHIFFRLGEFYLNYAEALNEYNPGNPDILKYVNLIRKRAGIPEYGSADLPVPASQEAMRQAIRAERRVELAFEEHRIWDTRRWKIAEQTDAGPFYGINVKGGTGLSDPNLYKRTVFENRVFQKKHYLWPIPQGELERNRKLVQNPFW